MGETVTQYHFDPDDYEKFSQRLHQSLAILQQLIKRPGFGDGPALLGAELELYITDKHCNALPINQRLVDEFKDKKLTHELNRYNLEYNLSPVSIKPAPFAEMAEELNQLINSLQQLASKYEGRVLPIGILPTLTEDDIDPAMMTDIPRYHALTKGVKALGNGHFMINIDGKTPLQFCTDEVTMEGANTSFQLHYQVKPERFAEVFNAIQLATPVVLALAANSPTIFGHELWHESRIALFKRTAETHQPHAHWHQPARANFGHGWVRHGSEELMAEAICLHPPLLPICTDTDYQQQMADGLTPSLDELRLHLGSVWSWNRPVYDPADAGHLRIEMRSLPAGPSVKDMMANAALLIGLAEGLADQMKYLLPAIPFSYVKGNFYEAAKRGLNAKLIWPSLTSHQLAEQPITKLVDILLPIACKGLAKLGISSEEIETHSQVIKDRVHAKQNGAIWQQIMLNKLKYHYPLPEALHQLTEKYFQNFISGKPVAQWARE
ncbi:glutamate--cysteine ligase [Endozoicomonas sp. SM1973]|uniref:Glutamate--cysteine ligase n=1 Tax=Spartinivicinus marinus TaxID=2994442 RepID=A0A853IGR0_9GAMM|nr:glutamate-cysteine ligase family protein [Spartinivicinus marinus]MCX4024915.1 glutamate-cysteine ligase family protein [Spartinivicinus marinus]NYZ69191.1 glutamate--cysteine ligase [Spartinivicinus marinus]